MFRILIKQLFHAIATTTLASQLQMQFQVLLAVQGKSSVPLTDLAKEQEIHHLKKW
jgi:hypothetical protein